MKIFIFLTELVLEMEEKLEINGNKHKIPEFVSIFPGKQNPIMDLDVIDYWLEQLFELSMMSKENFAKIKGVAHMMGMLYPFCNNLDRFENVFKIFLYSFIQDDHSDIRNKNLGHYEVAGNSSICYKYWGQACEVLDKLMYKDRFIKTHEWRPYTFILYKCVDTIFNDFNQEQKERFAFLWREAALAQVEETQVIEGGHTLSLEQYCQVI